jgi:hypothetical protein
MIVSELLELCLLGLHNSLLLSHVFLNEFSDNLFELLFNFFGHAWCLRRRWLCQVVGCFVLVIFVTLRQVGFLLELLELIF